MSDKNPARVDVEKWARCDTWHIKEGAMLLLDIEPFLYDPPCDWQRNVKSFEDIWDTARRSIDAGGLQASPRFEVRPREFLAWAREKGYSVPSALEKAVNRFHPEAKDRPQGNADRPKWPWGSHETKLLRDLAAAADRFWKNYDPSDPTTAPRSEAVTNWLMKERGLHERPAQVMAQILRADGLPTGPRK
jgi:hypothetical protein